MGNRSAMLALLTVLSLFSAFLYGFGRRFPASRESNVLKGCSAPPTNLSTRTEKEAVAELNMLYDSLRSAMLENAQRSVDATVYSAIENSPFLIAKYPDPQNRTVQNILGGLPDVVDIEYLNTLPTDDPRRHLLHTIQERRAELKENLQAIDAERGKAAKKETTYSVYQGLSRQGIDENLIDMCTLAAMEETRRRQMPEFSEYQSPEWWRGDGSPAEELVKFMETRCVVCNDSGVIATHPCMATYIPCFNSLKPLPQPASYTLAELKELSEPYNVFHSVYNAFFYFLVYPTIAESHIIAEKYPNPADRTPHKLLGGLANIISIEYMQSLEPHDPRRLFLDTLKAPDEQKCIELESNALLVDKAVMEKKNKAESFPLRRALLNVVQNGIEISYYNVLKIAKIYEMMRRYAKNNGEEGADPEGDAYRETLVGRPA